MTSFQCCKLLPGLLSTRSRLADRFEISNGLWKIYWSWTSSNVSKLFIRRGSMVKAIRHFHRLQYLQVRIHAHML